MSRRFLITTLPLADVEEGERIKEITGKEPELEISYGETIIDLLEVSAIREAYKDNDPLPNECVVYLYGQPYYVQTPYKEVRDQWLALMDGEPEASAPIDLGQAINTLAKALREDPELYYGYQSNIAMAFKDAYRPDSKQFPFIDTVANKAAKNFLDSLIKSLE